MIDTSGLIDLRGVYALLNKRVAQAGGNNAFAKENRVHKTTVSNWSNTNREVTDKLLDILGLEEVRLYRPKTNRRGGRNG
ncbi:hypothetical protein [Acetobacter cibinongensis]|uniref:XRE family transcriptional regulator n=1 Tax=Acetobacter cibinongensis TaxID=146475 RepID=A0A1Z5YW32_9PROT|nr:hypothetical protein [Acetobacter cibinongensis]OUJ03180.1 hypothetical protein HK14_03175 [Acetobacter cibinongensis]